MSKNLSMKTIIPQSKTLLQKAVFLLCILLCGISCTKDSASHELSQQPPPPPPPPQDSATVSIFQSQIPVGVPGNDGFGPIELGVKFQSAVAGLVTGISFYKNPGNLGTHTAQLYSADGMLLDSGVFTNETDSGWQTSLFANAYAIAANTVYIAAYHSSLGNYFSTHYGLKTAVVNAPLTALADSTEAGLNGIFKYTTAPAFPDSAYYSSNYWVDVIEKIKK
jgi:hypothetical protein